MRTRSLWVVRSLVAGSLLALASAAQAMPFTLVDRNSTALFETQEQAGQYAWFVDGVNHLSKQWFWYRAGSMSREMSIDTLQQVGAYVTDTNPFTDSRGDTLAVLYMDQAQSFQVELGLRLRGGAEGSGAADLGEQISIRNLGSTPLAFSFYQYVDFNLNGNPYGDVTAFPADNTVVQFKPGGSYVAETVITPRSSHHETHLVPITLDRLDDDLVTVLDDSNGAGYGDVAWAFEWDVVIAPGGEFLISKDKQIVPDAATLSLLGLGGVTMIRRRRR